jgi:hypothetical protein
VCFSIDYTMPLYCALVTAHVPTTLWPPPFSPPPPHLLFGLPYRGTRLALSTSSVLWTPPWPPFHQSCWHKPPLSTQECSTPLLHELWTPLSVTCLGKLPSSPAMLQHHSTAVHCS